MYASLFRITPYVQMCQLQNRVSQHTNLVRYTHMSIHIPLKQGVLRIKQGKSCSGARQKREHLTSWQDCHYRGRHLRHWPWPRHPTRTSRRLSHHCWPISGAGQHHRLSNDKSRQWVSHPRLSTVQLLLSRKCQRMHRVVEGETSLHRFCGVHSRHGHHARLDSNFRGRTA